MSLLASVILLVLLLLPSLEFYFQMLTIYFFDPQKNVQLYSAVPIDIESLQGEILGNYENQTYGFLDLSMNLLVLSAFLALFVRKNSKNIYSIMLTISSILLLAHLGGRGQIWWFYNALVPLYSLSMLKMKLILFQALFLLVPFFIDEASSRGFLDLRLSRNPKYRGFSVITKRIISSVLVITILVQSSAYELWPGNSNVEYMIGNIDLSRHVVPPVYDNVKRWMDYHRQSDEFFRIFWLPMDPATEGILLATFYDPALYYPLREDKPVVNLIDMYLQNALRFGWTTGLGRLLAPAGVKYIVINFAAVDDKFFNLVSHNSAPYLFPWGRQWSPTMYLAGNPRAYASILDREESLKVVERNEGFIIYENLNFIPFVKAYDRAFFVAPKDTINQTQEPQMRFFFRGNVSLSNHGSDLTLWNAVTSSGRVGKIFQIPIEGVITTIDFYVRENSGDSTTLSIYLSPEISTDYVASYNLTIPANQPPGWLSVPINIAWPHDKIFVYWFVKSASANWGFDTRMPYDDYYCANASNCNWVTWPTRSWVIVNMQNNLPYSEEPINRLKNTIFEKDTSSWKLNGTWSIDKGVFPSGLNAFKNVNEQTNKAWFLASQSLSVMAKSSYSVSGWVKIENAKQSQVRLRFYDRGGAVVGITSPLSGTDGTRDWWRFSMYGTVPEKAVYVDVELLGGWSYDQIQPGKTWFTNILFHQGYRQLLNPISENQFEWNYETVLASSPNHLMDRIPGFNGTNLVATTAMLPFNATDEEVKRLLSAMDGIVLMGDLVETDETAWIAKQPTLLSIYEAESKIIPADERWNHVNRDMFTNHYASQVLGKSEGSMKFFTPRDSYYRVALRAMILEVPSFKVDGEAVEVGEFSIGEDGFRWFEAEAVLLQKGWHTLSISVGEGEAILDQIVMISNIQAPKGLKEISSSSNPAIGVREDHTTLHKFQMYSEKPAFVVMLNSYDSIWNAYVDEQNLPHYSIPLNTYWANLYYVNSTGITSLKITFDRQNTRNISLSITITAWSSSLIALIYLQRTKIVILTTSSSRYIFKKRSMSLGRYKISKPLVSLSRLSHKIIREAVVDKTDYYYVALILVITIILVIMAVLEI